MSTHTPMRFVLMQDGPDALPMGELRPQHTYDGGTVIDCTEVGTSYERETYRMRLLPHLYDERDVDAAESARRTLVAGRVDRCCLTCQHAIVTATASAPCPYCGSRRLTDPV